MLLARWLFRHLRRHPVIYVALFLAFVGASAAMAVPKVIRGDAALRWMRVSVPITTSPVRQHLVDVPGLGSIMYVCAGAGSTIEIVSIEFDNTTDAPVDFRDRILQPGDSAGVSSQGDTSVAQVARGFGADARVAVITASGTGIGQPQSECHITVQAVLQP